MSYHDRVLSHNPTVYTPLDTSTLVENVGLIPVNLTATGTVFNSPDSRPLAYGMGNPVSFTDVGRIGWNDTDTLWPNREHMGFTVETWVKSDGIPTATRRIWGRNASGAINITPEGISLSITSAGVTNTVTYQVATWAVPYYVALTYSQRLFSFYVNGELVGDLRLDGGFAGTHQSQTVGGTSTAAAQRIFMSGFAYYRRALSNNIILDHYLHGLTPVLPTDLMEQRGAVTYDFTDQSADVVIAREDDATKYNEVILNSNTVLKDNFIVTNGAPAVRELFPTDLSDIGVVDGSKITWDGAGVTVSVRYNDVDPWVSVPNGGTIPGLEEGVNTSTGRIILFRVDIAVGGWYKSMRATVYVNKNSRGSLSGVMTTGYENYSLATKEQSIVSNHPRSGLLLRGGYIDIPPSLDSTPYRTIEMWVRLPAAWGAPQYLIDFRPGTTAYIYNSGTQLSLSGFAATYVNGVSKTPVLADFPVGQWVHLVLVLSSSTADRVRIGSRYSNNEMLSVDVHSVGLYHSEIRANVPAVNFKAGFRKSLGAVTESGGTITEMPGLAYKSNWTYEQA